MEKRIAKNIILTCIVTLMYCIIWMILEFIMYKTIQNKLIDNIMIATFIPTIYIAINKTQINHNNKESNKENSVNFHCKKLKIKDNLIPGSIKTKCPYDGRILSIKVSVGDYVKKGDTIIILDALKMENYIAAPANGIVAYIGVQENTTVDKETILFSLY